MATRVHGAVDTGCEIEPGVLGHRKSVHVSAQEHRRTGMLSFESGGDTRCGLVEGDAERETFECFEHVVARDRKVVADLGPFVQRAPKGDSAALMIECFFGET